MFLAGKGKSGWWLSTPDLALEISQSVLVRFEGTFMLEVWLIVRRES